MTDNRATQVSIEEFASTNPPAQVTQVTIEQWVTTATITGQALVTQVALEQWVPATIDLAGNLGGSSSYGKISYGLGQYSRINAFAPTFAADLSIQAFSAVDLVGGLAPIVVLAADLDVRINLIEFAGDIAPQIALGGSLSLILPLMALDGSFGLTVVLGASSFVSGPLWAASEPCPPPVWDDSELCPPSLWTPTVPPSWELPGVPEGWGMGKYGVSVYQPSSTSPWLPPEQSATPPTWAPSAPPVNVSWKETELCDG